MSNFLQSLNAAQDENDESMMMREAYANQIIEGMDNKSMEQFVFDTIMQNLESYSKEELTTEITECYGEEWLEENGFQ